MMHNKNRKPKTYGTYRPEPKRPDVTEPMFTESYRDSGDSGDYTISVVTALLFTLFGVLIGYLIAGMG